MIAMHTCRTRDGASIPCICSTGRDHDDTEMDQQPAAGSLTVIKLGHQVAVATELLVDAGVIPGPEPTAAELAEQHARQAAHDAHEQAQREAYAAVVDSADGLLREVLQLHAPVLDGHWQCVGCTWWGEGEPPDWPCPTAELALPTPVGAPA